MKLSISYKQVESHKPVEAEIDRRVGKLEKLLQSYSPDLIQLHGAFSKTPRTDENSCSLNLSLPTGTLHATGTGATVRASCKKAFSELEAQVKKHQAKLRKDYEWKRKRSLPRAEALS
jgi:ribosome-associated translation inhibitor RaiA